MSQRLKERNYEGAITFDRKGLQSQLESYIGNGGPVRTESFLDFAKNSSAFFTSDNMKALNASLGNVWRKSMEDSLRRIITGSNNRTASPKSITKMDKFLNTAIGNIMFINVRSALLQGVSVSNFAVGGDVSYFKYVGSKKAREARAIIMKSEFMKDRMSKGQTDVVTQELLAQSSDGLFERGINAMSKFGYIPTKAMDAFAVAVGGAPYLAAKIDQYGGDIDRAMQDFIVKANEAQQSTNPERLGSDQTHPVGRYLLAFTNATQQFNRIMAKSAREIADGKDLAKNYSTISYYMGAQIAGFSFLQKWMWNAFDFDEDDEKTSDWLIGIIDSMATSAGILGSVVGTAAQTAKQIVRNVEDGKLKMGGEQKILKELLSISPAISTKVRNLTSALKEPFKQSQGPIKVDPSIGRTANALQFLGIPAERILRIFESMNDLGAQDLNLLEKAARVLGWSRYDLEQNLGKEGDYGRRGRTLRDRQREERQKERKKQRQ